MRGIGGGGSAPVNSSASSRSVLPVGSAPAGTAFLAGPHLGTRHLTRRNAGASGGRAAGGTLAAPCGGAVRTTRGCRHRQAEISLLEPADLVAQPCRLFEFEIGSGATHLFLEISHDGQHLFAVNTGSVSISSYSIATDGSLTLVKTTPVNAPTQEPEDARLSPDGTTLWVVDSGGDTVSGFTVDGGSLTEPPTSPTPGPVGTDPIGIVVT